MPSNRPERREEARFRILRLLKDNPEMSTRDIAHAVGVSHGAAWYLLAALIEKGLVKAQNFSKSDQKAKYAYVLTPVGLAEKARLTRSFLDRKRNEFEDLRQEIESLSEELSETELTGKN